jgi:hypothetical protein
MLQIAQEFAALMDQNRFEEAVRLLSDDCKYFIGSQVLVGPEQIAASYSANYESASKRLDEIIFLSEIVELDQLRFRLCYLDRIRKGSVWHEHRCEQIIKFQGKQIAEIRHVDLPGELDALQEFYSRVGLKA